MNLAIRDVEYRFGRFLLTAFGLGLLLVAVMAMGGIYRGMVERELLDRIDLGHRANMHLATLSGGEQQRVAVACAVVNDPAVILADEPTAALDTERGKSLMDLLRRLCREQHAAVLVVTHDERMIEGFDRVYYMTDGRVTNHP